PPERRRAATSSGAADREAAEQLAALVHAIRIPVAQVDERFRIQWVNLAFCAAAGEPAPSLVGRPFSDLLDDASGDRPAHRIRGQGITGSVFVSGVGEIVEDSENDPRAMTVPGTPAEESSLLCVPLVARRRVMGVITLARIGAQRRPFVQEDLEIASLFAGQC